MDGGNLLFQPLTQQNFDSARDWREQQRQTALKNIQSRGYFLRTVDPSSHELSIYLDRQIKPDELTEIRRYQLYPWMHTRFQRFRNMPNTIRVEWPVCNDHENEMRGHSLLKSIFQDMTLTFDESVPCALRLCDKMSIRVPERIYGPTPIRYHFPEEEKINVEFASCENLKEFHWAGDFVYFFNGFLGVPSETLTVFTLTDCQVCMSDVLELLTYAPNLEHLTLRTITNFSRLYYRNTLPTWMADEEHARTPTLRHLRSVTMDTTTSVMRFFRNVESPGLQSLYLSIAGEAIRDLQEAVWLCSSKVLYLHQVTIECIPEEWRILSDGLKDLAKFKKLRHVTKKPTF
ncbi:hypothetical protein CVT26_008901 [Gymnopilus dilepis]|uniref:F-box domain-containing protein n=1 Tax=Gymnopilus dilepis TaxID=231916 RepID=A0A409YAU8_9AGAR|nr:hypothetical protein CVT26_008901 [Gymnopilus dilepis]